MRSTAPDTADSADPGQAQQLASGPQRRPAHLGAICAFPTQGGHHCGQQAAVGAAGATYSPHCDPQCTLHSHLAVHHAGGVGARLQQPPHQPLVPRPVLPQRHRRQLRRVRRRKADGLGGGVLQQLQEGVGQVGAQRAAQQLLGTLDREQAWWPAVGVCQLRLKLQHPTSDPQPA